MDPAVISGEAIDAAGFGLCMLDTQDVIVYLSPNAQRLLSPLSGCVAGARWPDIVADNQPHLDELASPSVQSPATGVREYRLKLPGSEQTTELTVRLLAVADDGRPLTCLLLQGLPPVAPPPAADGARDRESLFRDAPEIMLLLDKDGGILDANDAAAEAYGYSPAELRAMNVAQLRVSATVPLLRRQLAEATGGAVASYETTHIRRDGSVFPAEVRLRVRPSGGEDVLICAIRDLTRRRRSEETRALAAVAQIAAGVAHEANNIFASMVLQAERAALKDTVEAYRQLGALVPRAVAKATEICHSLVSFARPPQAPRELTRLEALVDAALLVTAGQLERAGIAVTCRWATGLAPVHVTAGQVQQVFLSLIINACHAMPEGGELLVSTSTERGTDGRAWVVAEVRDTGVGIAPEDLPSIFNPFYTTKAALGEGKVAGIGLGLSVARSIIAAHGGTIVPHSEPGVGSSFFVRLPAAAEDEASVDEPPAAAASAPPDKAPGDAEPGSAQPPEPSTGSAHRALRLLLVEDETDLRETLAEGLAKQGYRVVTAADGEKGAEAVSRGDFELVVTDLMMPAGGGAAVIRVANALCTPPRILVITGKQGPGLEGELAALGVRDVLCKPFRASRLVAAIEAATRRS